MGIADMLLSKRRNQEPQAVTDTMQPGEAAQSPVSASIGQTSPAQAAILEKFGKEMQIFSNPMILNMLSQLAKVSGLGKPGQAKTDQDFLLALIDALRNDAHKTHSKLHELHSALGELLNADHDAGYSTEHCANTSESRENGNIRHDGSREDDPGRHTEGGMADAISEREGADSGHEATLPGGMDAARAESGVSLPEMGHEQ